MKTPMLINGLEISLAIAVGEDMLSRWLGLPASTWKQKLAIAAAIAAGLVVWHGYRFGWNRLLDPSLAGESALTAVLGWVIWNGGEWLICHMPYTPTVFRANDTSRL